MNTFLLRKEDVVRNWYVVDAVDKPLGRLSAQIAVILMGKHRATYTPSVDSGDHVIVLNAGQVKITGNKANTKEYASYSGYRGGHKTVRYNVLKKTKPERIIELAVKRMLPKSRLGDRMIKRLKVYAKGEHPHQVQNPQPLSLRY